MVVLIQKREIQDRNQIERMYKSCKSGMILPAYRTIWEGQNVPLDLKKWIREEFGIGQYLIRICNGGNKGLKIHKVVVESSQTPDII